MKVRYLRDRNNKPISNQFVIEHEGVVWFQSYTTVIARVKKGKVTLDYDWDYSITIGNCRNLFLGEGKEVTKAKIASGKYAVGNLNREEE